MRDKGTKRVVFPGPSEVTASGRREGAWCQKPTIGLGNKDRVGNWESLLPIL